ncbi:MAG: NAD(P)H-quinone oxidoreductase subunit L [Rivularia sp. (in: Bacteria)]|nr:NAD(P)H-quinone oxidoreductase subunit L [Rivularia sp. MS3]
MLQNLLDYLQNLQLETAIVPLTYLGLAVSYLLVIPVLVLTYMKFRWYSVSSFERGFMYFLVFLFFPGLLLLSPFLNFRPKRRQIEV